MFRQNLQRLVICCVVFCTCLGIVYFHESNESETLVIFSWPNLFDPAVLRDFEQEYNCKVIYSLFESNEAMYAKIRSSGSDPYDIIVGTAYIAELMHKDGWLAKIDVNQLPNLSYIDRKILSYAIDCDMEYSVPFAVDLSLIAFNAKRVPCVPDSWLVFSSWDSLRKRMTMLDDPLEVIGFALLTLGYANDDFTPEPLARAKQFILSCKKNLATFSSSVGVGMHSGEFLLSHAYFSDVLRHHTEGSPVEYVIPKEGTIINFDNFLLLKSSKKKALAHAFMNSMLNPKNAAKHAEVNFMYPPNWKAQQFISKKLRSIFDRFYGETSQKNQWHTIRWEQGTEQAIFSAWDEIKSS